MKFRFVLLMILTEILTTDFADNANFLEKAKPVLETLPGWKMTEITGIKKYEDLPKLKKTH